MHIVTNFERFPLAWRSGSEAGQATRVPHQLKAFARHLPDSDWLLVNGRPEIVLALCALMDACPPLRRPIVSVDLVLRAPSTRMGAARALGRRLLLSRVDFFVHFFRDLNGYRRHYGIGPDRSAYVPFKPNIARRSDLVLPEGPGRYVLGFGRSLRDFDTFFDAVALLPYPVAIARPDFACLAAHGARFTRRIDRLPRNVELLDDDGSEEAQIRMIAGARLVVLPILRTSLCASGIGSYLNAMRLRRCVIVSEGPGASDVLDGEVLQVPPEDPRALASMIRRAMEDDALRDRVAQTGYRYALSLGDEQASRQRILDAAIAGLRARGRLPSTRS